MTADEKGFLAAIKKDPKDATARGAYADWLDEHGRAHEAMLQRSAAGLSEIRYKIRRKSDGLFSEGAEGHHQGKEPWTTKGKMWPALAHLRQHINGQISSHYYYRQRSRKSAPPEFLYQGDTPLSDLEVEVVELRFVVGARMSLSLKFDKPNSSKASIDLTELGREDAAPAE